MRRTNPRGYIINPHGVIEIQTLVIEQSVFWGKLNKKLGRPAWLRPERVFRSKQFPFVLLATNSLAPIPIPGEEPVNTDKQRLSKVVEEQYEKHMSISNPLDAASLQMWFMIAMMILILGLVGMAIALGMGTIISEKFFNQESDLAFIARFLEVV